MRWKALIGIIAIALIIFNLPKVVAQSVEVETSREVKELGASVLHSFESRLTSVVKRVDPAVVVVKNAHGSVATGVLYRPDGYLLTTALVEPVSAVNANSLRARQPVKSRPKTKVNKTKFTIQLPDGDTYEAQFVGRDVATGIVVLKIDAVNLPVAEFGDSDKLMKGSWVMVIGNSYGMSNSISTGIVGGLDRHVNSREMFQITAPINPGMSGAPVISSDGHVVGLVASTFRRGLSTWKEELMLQAARSLGEVNVDVLTKYLENMPEEQAQTFVESMVYPAGMSGIYITKVYHLKHANAAGLESKLKNLFQKHEEISINIAPDERLNSLIISTVNHLHHDVVPNLVKMLDKPEPASQVALEAMLNASQAEIEAISAAQRLAEVQQRMESVQKNLGGAMEGMLDKLNQLPVVLSSEGMNFAIPINDVKYAAERLIEHGKVNYGWLGVNVRAVPPGMRAQLDLEKTPGVLIESVVRSSPAEKAGLKQWDIVRRFNNIEVDSPKTLQRLSRRTKPGRKVPIEVIRKGKPLKLKLEIGKAKF